MTKFMFVLSLGVALAAGGVRLSAQKQQQVFISLTGADGKPVEGLQASDVGITENDVNCKIVKVEPIDWPTKVQILVDNGRANTTPINPLRDGLKALFQAMPEGTEMSLYTTAGTPRNIVKPTTDKQKMIDGIGLIAADGGAGMFFDALSEAAARVDKDKVPGFPMILMVGSDFGQIRVLDREYAELQNRIIDKGIIVHVVVTSGTGGASGGVAQTDVGLQVTKMSGGKYENITASSRLATLLPEMGQKMAASAVRQRHQYRVTYERPDKPSAQPAIGATIKKEGNVQLSLRGSLP
jgi:hypothetical protein